MVDQDWFFWSHRRVVAERALARGWEVTLISQFSRHRTRVEKLGVETRDILLRGGLRGVVSELTGLFDLARHYRGLGPAVVHHVSLKPILMGSIAAWLAGVPAVVNAVSGLGYVYSSSEAKAAFMRLPVTLGLRCALKRSGTVALFQNRDDVSRLLGPTAQAEVEIVAGCGADLERFSPAKFPDGDTMQVLFAGRMLKSKGVGALAKAVLTLAAEGLPVRLTLAGDVDPKNPESYSVNDLAEWEGMGPITWLGRVDHVSRLMAESHVVALPSDREGLPKVLVEAAASGRPAIATDVPGCRDVVRHGKTGLLVPLGDDAALIAGLRYLATNPDLRARMGDEARRLAVAKFDETELADRTVDIYDRLWARLQES